MPIYAYRCGACGHAKDVLQKLSDAPLSTCPACGAQAFTKQVTAAGFQLKGSGWYVTDFRGGSGGTSAPAASGSSSSDGGGSTPSGGSGGGTTGGGTSASGSGDSSSGSPSSSSGSGSGTSCGGGCACH
ncbi:putative regulatory protein, FmdB family [Roseateles sp. YR242]|uniref:FmdB family zinc ribbon protein n=1 Tax=Roseateles sp. YR242 TaxID=1855305 RepID=UPI0008C83634|nr:FmdB family zinc ribbon protein [Roseateles sp. YR242]SEK51131.1 putative regulatory protein, FmdB family [Roseateles sp. YR242]